MGPQRHAVAVEKLYTARVRISHVKEEALLRTWIDKEEDGDAAVAMRQKYGDWQFQTTAVVWSS